MVENVVITRVGTIEVEWIREDGTVHRTTYMKEDIDQFVQEVSRAWVFCVMAGWVPE